MEKVIKYKCSECGELFDIPENALACERRHKRIEKANDMLEEGYTLKQINEECKIWGSVPEHLENINKDVRGCGSWSGYYGNRLNLSSSDLKNPRPKEELFIDSRYTSRW